jgi:hypothetical protein
MFNRFNVKFIDEGGGARERFLVNGSVNILKTDAIHIYDKGIQQWIIKHIKLASLESTSGIKQDLSTEVIKDKVGSSVWLRQKVWRYLPRLIRPFLLFFYRYIIKLGFLDGKVGLFYCVLHDLWYPFLVEVLNFEKLINYNVNNSNI